MNSLNTDTAAREQETMMRRGFGMLSGRFSVLNGVQRVALVAVLAMVFSLAGYVSNAEAAVSVVGTPASGVSTASFPIAFAATVPAGADLCVVGVAWDNRDVTPATTVVFNGTDSYTGLTQYDSPLNNKASTKLYYFVNPTAATGNVVVNFSGTHSGKPYVAGMTCFSGVDTGNPLGTEVGVAGTADPATINVSSAVGDMVVDVVNGYKSTGATAGAGQTERWANGTSGTTWVEASTEPGAASVTMSWTGVSPSGENCISAVNINAAPVCTDTNSSAVAIINPINLSTVSGSLSIVVAETNVLATEYRIAGGAWTPIATAWDTLAAYPGSATAPVSGVLIEVRAEDDDCPGAGVYLTDSVTVTVDNTCTPSGSLAITAGQTLNGNPIDLTSISTATGAANVVYKVTSGAGGAPTILQLDDWEAKTNNGTDFTPNWVDDGSCWYTQNGANTPSGSTSGSGSMYAYLEGSGTGATNGCAISATGTFTFEQTSTLDAGSYSLVFSFDYNNNAADAADVLYLDVWNGASWDLQATTIQTGPTGGVTAGTVDLDALGYASGLIKVRFRYILGGNGNTWDKDLVLDNLKFVGTPRSTTHYDSSVDGPATTVDTTGWPSPSTLTLNLAGEDAICTGSVLTPAQDTFDWTSCTDTDLATLTTTDPGIVNGMVTIQTAVGVETSQSSMQNMTVTIAGAGACNVNNAAMTWNTGSSRWEYSWDTSACGTVSAVNGVTIDVNGNEPDCSNPLISAPQITGVSIDNTCFDSGVTVSLDPIAAPITGLISVGATSNRANSVQVSLDGTSWSASGSLNYTPPAQSTGSQSFYARSQDNCGAWIFDTNNPTSVAYETRTNNLVVLPASAAQLGINGITITMPYLGDKDGNATFSYRYQENTGGYNAWSTPELDAGGISPKTFTLSGLTNDALVDIEVQYADTGLDLNGNPNPQPLPVQLVAWTDNPLLHNSLRFACDLIGYADQTSCEGAGGIWNETGKWATGWGTSTGEYGPILCSTCHAKGTPNIKRISTSITAATGSYPGNAETIAFATVSGALDSFGDDAGGHTTSTKVCETCHSQNQYHNYDTANNTGGLTHQNQNDCIGCHTHKTGFRASCTSCHANPPVDVSGLVVNGGTPGDATGSASAGAHNLHTTGSLSYDCNVCHTGWENAGEMPKAGSINIGFAPFAVNDAGALYKGRNGGAGYLQGASTTVSQDGTQTCAVYCHGDSLSSNVGDWDANTGGACGDCHAVTAGTISGLPSGASHSTHVNGQGLTCNQCHGAGYSSVAAPAGHVNGSISYDVSGLPGTSPTYAGAASGAVANWAPSASYGNCSNISCHGAGTPQWGATLGCDSCHGYPPTGAGGSTDHFTRTGKASTDAAFYGAHADCSTCHGVSGNVTPPAAATARAGYIDLNASGGNTYVDTMHNDGKVQMNGYNAATGNGADDTNAGYDGAGGCTAACHAQSVKLSGTIQANTVELREFGSGACTSCHDGTGTAGTATAISDSSPHAKVATSLNCEDCHGSHGGGTIEIPNNATVGINYTANGEAGIALGVAVTAPGATEAEICWNCHDAQAPKVSEWGTNNNADGITYNYGSMSTGNSSWLTGNWVSGTGAFGYKTGAIKSTHSVNSAGTSAVGGTAYSVGGMTETVDAVANIRCSYCHDVHDLNTLASDNSTGKPYLRGTWKGNPYNEDGAPQTGMTGWTNSQTGTNKGGSYGAVVPRASASTTNNAGVGGYWIDQNSGNPNNGASLAGTAGLCILCHDKDAGGNPVTVNTMDYTTGEVLWVGTNGHANAVIGGTGTGAANIFRNTLRGGNATPITNTQNTNKNDVSMGLAQETNRGYAYRGQVGYNYNPTTNPAYRGYAFEAFEWGISAFSSTPQISAGTIKLTVDESTTQAQYHTFNCGKCHNPHASRLPKLMITNCLDTNHNTWQDAYQTDGSGGATNGERAANWLSAQNCHRRGPTEAAGETGSGTAFGAGWNKVTPW